jgi:AcrR family transcriptional regulator
MSKWTLTSNRQCLFYPPCIFSSIPKVVGLTTCRSKTFLLKGDHVTIEKKAATEAAHPIDRRVSRTRRALRESLLSLIQQKGYDSITVEEIASRANLGRATFYLHYKDKEDLLLEEFSELASDRVKLLSQIPLSAWKPVPHHERSIEGSDALPAEEMLSPIAPLLLVFQHAAEHAALYRLVLHGESAPRVGARVREIIQRAISEVIQARLENDPDWLPPQAPIDFLASYFAGALLGSIAWWLAEDLPLNPEEMTRLFQRMFFPGMGRVLGL